MDLIIVRHARPEKIENAEGPADPPLSPLGIEQAEAAAEFLSQEKIDQIVTSSMQRAYETAIPLSKHIGIDPILRDDLRESDHNSGTYIPVEEMTLDSGPVQAYMNDPLTIFEGDYDGFRDRVVGAFDQIIEENAGKKVAVFCHGMVTSVYLQTLWNLEHPFLLQPDYTGITRVQASSRGFRTVRSINETGHVRDLIERPKFGKMS
jgi:probable phosphoglycerate mutase